jgi:ribonuclease J
MTSLTFYGGVNEVGGNKILLEDKDTKIFLDFGMSFTARGKYFEEYLKPRSSNGLVDFITMGLLPDLEGIYRTDLLEKAGKKEESVQIDAVLLSHAHADHANYISFLHKDIPIYMGHTTHNLLKAIQERSPSSIEQEILEFNENGSKRGAPKIQRKINEFSSGKKFKIGSLEIEPIHVDHSVPGAYGFIIYTSSGPVVYTGDLRRHGTKLEMTEEFIESAKSCKPIALLAEGTRIADEPTNESEHLVFQESDKLASGTDKTIFADFNFKDVDRVRTFYDVAKRNGRKLVVRIPDCFYLKYFHQDKTLDMPNFDDPDILIFKHKTRTGTYSDSDYYGGQRFFATQENTITAAEISKNPGKYLCALGFYYFGSLIDIKPSTGTPYIHSASEPWDEEQEIAQERVNNWLNKFGMNKYQIHCSGHAKGSDLMNIVKEIDAKILFPIHSEHPTEYARITNKITIVDEGKKYQL